MGRLVRVPTPVYYMSQSLGRLFTAPVFHLSLCSYFGDYSRNQHASTRGDKHSVQLWLKCTSGLINSTSCLNTKSYFTWCNWDCCLHKSADKSNSLSCWKFQVNNSFWELYSQFDITWCALLPWTLDEWMGPKEHLFPKTQHCILNVHFI